MDSKVQPSLVVLNNQMAEQPSSLGVQYSTQRRLSSLGQGPRDTEYLTEMKAVIKITS